MKLGRACKRSASSYEHRDLGEIVAPTPSFQAAISPESLGQEHDVREDEHHHHESEQDHLHLQEVMHDLLQEQAKTTLQPMAAHYLRVQESVVSLLTQLSPRSCFDTDLENLVQYYTHNEAALKIQRWWRSYAFQISHTILRFANQEVSVVGEQLKAMRRLHRHVVLEKRACVCAQPSAPSV